MKTEPTKGKTQLKVRKVAYDVYDVLGHKTTIFKEDVYLEESMGRRWLRVLNKNRGFLLHTVTCAAVLTFNIGSRGLVLFFGAVFGVLFLGFMNSVEKEFWQD